MPSFAAIPPYVEHLLTGAGATLPGLPERADRVVVILLDAFGRVFRERFADHPLIRRLAVCELESQFPSTTAAHVTTMHSGLPVGQHGVYEWNVYEPSLDRVIMPLRFSFSEDAEGDTLRGHLDPRGLVPPDPCLYERLAVHGVVSLVYQPDAFSPSTFDGAVVRAADVRPYRDFGDGLSDALRSVRALERGYAYVYFHVLDLVANASEAVTILDVRAKLNDRGDSGDTAPFAVEREVETLPRSSKQQVVVDSDRPGSRGLIIQRHTATVYDPTAPPCPAHRCTRSRRFMTSRAFFSAMEATSLVWRCARYQSADPAKGMRSAASQQSARVLYSLPPRGILVIRGGEKTVIAPTDQFALSRRRLSSDLIARAVSPRQPAAFDRKYLTCVSAVSLPTGSSRVSQSLTSRALRYWAA